MLPPASSNNSITFPMNRINHTDTRTPEALLNNLRILVNDAATRFTGAPKADAAKSVDTLRAWLSAARECLTDLHAGPKSFEPTMASRR
jgi:hypothetical protein